jgi:Zn-finger protein
MLDVNMKTLNRILSRFQYWLSSHVPVQCSICFCWMFRKNAIDERTTAGAQVRLCSTCHANIFHPFTKTGRR